MQLPELTTVFAEDVPIFRGRYGQANGRKAIRFHAQAGRREARLNSEFSTEQEPVMSTSPRSGPGRGRSAPCSNGVAVDGKDVNIDMILDVPVTLAMEVGRTRISIRNLLQLNQGSVVELDRAAGEPLDVFVNGTLVAHGEVVVINEKFGIRLTDVISPAERVRKLR